MSLQRGICNEMTLMPGPRVARVRSLLEWVSLVATVLTCIVVVWFVVGERAGRSTAKRPGIPVLPAEPLPIDGMPIDGERQAEVAIVVFSDFQCPFCGKFAVEILPVLRSRYVRSGKVLLGYRHFPLPSHRLAAPAAVASNCAGQQGQFWQMHDLLFADPQHLDNASLEERASRLPLDQNRFAACLSGPPDPNVRRDIELGKNLAISGTPTIFVGSVTPTGIRVTARIDGAKPVEDFVRAVETQLDREKR